MNKIESILRLHNKYFLDKKKYEDIENMFQNDLYRFTLLYEKEELIGYMIVYNSFDFYELFEIVVDENYRKLGKAKNLLSELPKDKEVFLEVSENNDRAIKIYEKNGFKKISVRKRYYLDKSNAIIMKRME